MLFRSPATTEIYTLSDTLSLHDALPFRRSSEAAALRRKKLRVGIPRVLNIYSTAPFFRTYFEAIGIPKQNIVFSDETTEEMWVEGGKYGSIDPCYPSKVAQAHIHNLLFAKHDDGKTPDAPEGTEDAKTSSKIGRAHV